MSPDNTNSGNYENSDN